MYVQRLDENCVTELCAAQILIDLKSCVQELVDNAIDAKSNEIKIRVVDHGTKLIEVIDDGEGMTVEDLKIACVHNSTSKIRALGDLSYTRSTLGFRGEALNALANMSDLTLSSRTNNMDLAARVTYAPSGKVKGEILYEWRPIGTSVFVENLFFKFPVRLIQMERESKKQVIGILQLLTAYSLIHCHIRFVFVTQSAKAPLPKPLFNTQGSRNEGFRESCNRLFGRGVAQSMIDINFNHTFNERTIMSLIQGLLTSPCLNSFTSSKNIAFLFVNRYYVVSGLSNLIHSITALYQNYNSKKVIPHYILNIQIPHNLVDYNVTTTKQKVFISDIKNITNMFLQYLKNHFFLNISLVPKTLKIVEEKDLHLNEDPSKVETNEKAQDTSQQGQLKIMAIYNSKEDFTLSSTELRNKRTNSQYSSCGIISGIIGKDQNTRKEREERSDINKEKLFDPKKTNHAQSYLQKADVKPVKKIDLQSSAKSEVVSSVFDTSEGLSNDSIPQLKKNGNATRGAWSHEEQETFSSELECQNHNHTTDISVENSFDCFKELAREMINVQRCEWMKVHLKLSESSDMHVSLESCLDKEEGVFVPLSHLQTISLETKTDLASSKNTFFFSKDFFSSLKIIGQFNKGFIICSLLCCNEAKLTTREIFVVDQHATDEKYEELCLKTKVTKTQALVQPLKLSLSSIEKQIVLDNLNIFRLNGFYIQEGKEMRSREMDCNAYNDQSQMENALYCESSTPSPLYVHGLPLFESQLLDTDDILDLINKLQHQECICYQDESLNYVIFRPQKLKSIMASKACRSAIMIGDELSYSKMAQIVQRMISMQHPWACPHGRPTLRHLCSIH